jgi:pilus assembly protein CpaF
MPLEIWVYNHFDDTREVVPLDGGGEITIGRESGNTVRLQSTFVSRQHARITRSGNDFTIESLGLNGTVVANRTLGPGESARLHVGDEIRLGEYSVYLVSEGAKAEAAAAQEDPRRKVLDIERQIHAQLLAKLNLRAVGAGAKNDPEYTRTIKTVLNQLVAEVVPTIDQALGDHMIEELLRRLTAAEVTRRATGQLLWDYGFDDSDVLEQKYEQAVGRVIRLMLRDLELTLDPERVRDDLDRVDAQFHERFQKYSKQVTLGLWRYLVQRRLTKDIQDIIFGLGPIQDLLEMPNVQEVMVVGKDKIYIEKNGLVENTRRSFFSDEIVEAIIERIVMPVGRKIDRSTPMVDARLPDGSRVNAVIPPLALAGPVLTVRKFSKIPFTIDDLVERGTLDRGTAQFLRGTIVGRKNLLISGGTSSGKTTLLNVLSAFVSPRERIVTIEDSAELQLPQEHVVGLETRPANVEGRGAYAIRDLVRNALRMRPDRLIVGEVRGPEALDMLQAMNTGHDGSLTTIHANSPEDSLMRLETMALMAVDMPVRAIREQIVAALDVIVQLARFADGRRRVTHINEVVGMDRDAGTVLVQPIFLLRDQSKTGRLVHTGYIPSFTNELLEKKVLDLSAFL